MIGIHRNSWFKYKNDNRFRCPPHRRFRRLVRTKVECTDTGETIPITIKEVNSNYITIDGAIAVGRRDNGESERDEDQATGNWWEKIFHGLDGKSKNMLINTRVLCDGHQLTALLRDSKLILVSDGSFDPTSRIGTAAFRMEEAGTRRIVVQGVCQTPGAPIDVNAYRSELIGIMLLLKILDIIVKNENIQEGRIILACDNEGGLKKCFCSRDRPTINANHFDIIWEIVRLINTSPVQMKVFHIRGHVSKEDREGNQLSQMNEDMDQLAKSFLRHCIEKKSFEIKSDFQSQFWSMSINGRKIVRNVDKTITEWIHGNELKNFLIKKERLTNISDRMIDWTALNNNGRTKTHADTLWCMKLDSQFIPVGKWMLRCDEWSDDVCPICQSEEETIEHLFQCECEKAKAIRHKHIETFLQWTISSETDEDIKACIIEWLLHGGL